MCALTRAVAKITNNLGCAIPGYLSIFKFWNLELTSEATLHSVAVTKDPSADAFP